jgi:hypothetical protein
LLLQVFGCGKGKLLKDGLSDAKATENLIQSLTKKDEVSGQTYLQIPVENEAAAKNAVSLLAGLFKGFSGK